MSAVHSIARTRAVAYYRMSSDKQETSIANQRSAVTAYADEHGFEIIRDYTDEGISGDDTARRIEFQRMIKDAEKRKDFVAVLCWDQDRFGRFDPLEAGFWIQPLRRVGAWLETVAQGRIDWDTFAGRVLYTIQQEGKHQFLTDLSFKSMTGQVESALRGNWQGGAAPYGYDVVDRPGRPPNARKWPRMLVPGDPRKVEIVQWMYRTYAENDVSIRWIGDELHRRGVPSATGCSFWTAGVIRRVLMRREYVGDLDWGRVVAGKYHGLDAGRVKPKGRKSNKRGKLDAKDLILVQGAHDAIIDRDLWAAVQAKLAGRKRLTTPERNGGRWLLSGMLICGHCGSSMVGSCNPDGRTRKSYRYRLCCGYHEHGRKFCHRHSVREEQIAEVVIRKLQEEVLNPDTLVKLREEIRRQESEAQRGDPIPAKRLRAKVADLDRKIDTGNRNMTLAPPDAIAGIAATVRGFRAERDAATGQLERIESGADRADLEAQVVAAESQLWRLTEAIQSADPAEVRAVLREVVAQVELWWECKPATLRQRCSFTRGVIHLRGDENYNRLVAHGRASAWL